MVGLLCFCLVCVWVFWFLFCVMFVFALRGIVWCVGCVVFGWFACLVYEFGYLSFLVCYYGCCCMINCCCFRCYLVLCLIECCFWFRVSFVVYWMWFVIVLLVWFIRYLDDLVVVNYVELCCLVCCLVC